METDDGVVMTTREPAPRLWREQLTGSRLVSQLLAEPWRATLDEDPVDAAWCDTDTLRQVLA